MLTGDSTTCINYSHKIPDCLVENSSNQSKLFNSDENQVNSITYSNFDKKDDFPSKSENSALGTYTKSCKLSLEEKKERYEKKQEKQEAARKLVGGRLNICGRIPVVSNVDGNMIAVPEKLQSVKLLKKGEDSFAFGGLMRCGSVWVCPSCASIITEFRRDQLVKAHAEALKQGLSVSMLTLTVAHYHGDRLVDVLEGISKALRLMKNRKHFKVFAKECGLVGDVRTLEATYGKNGWHPHFHILLFTRQNMSFENLNDYKRLLLTQWQRACMTLKMPCPNEHGLDLVDGTWAAAYVSKWGVEEEMTKGNLKKGKKEGHLSPFGLLEVAAGGDEKAAECFQEYAKAFKGKRQLVWSKGLKEMLGVNDDLTDQEIIENEEKKAEVFMVISYEDYKLIIDNHKQAECLFMCSAGKDAVLKWLDNLRKSALRFPFYNDRASAV